MDKIPIRAYFAELIGTFAVVFLGAGAVCVNYMTAAPEMRPGLVGIALAHGLAYAVALSVTLHISGGYLNPAITLMFWSFNRLDTGKAAWYIGAQLLGGVLAGLCLYQTFDVDVLRASHLGTPHVNLQAFRAAGPSWEVVATGTGIELLLTFFVVLAIFGSILDTKGPRVPGLMAGLALAAVTFVGFSLTGAATNPARWFGTVMWERLEQKSSHPFEDMFVYVAGPIVGSLLAGVVYYKLILPADKSDGVLASPTPSAAGPGSAKK
jgi:aquaporin Z